MKNTVALLLSTYNWPQALELILKSIQQQTVLPNEILIADDGSKGDTRSLIEHYQKQFSTPIRHIWHEDKGFRRSKILNKAVANSSADYIIQIDGDCIPHKDFVKDHISSRQEGVYLHGVRVNILEKKLSEIFENKKINFPLFSKHIKNRTRNIRIPLLASLNKPYLVSTIRDTRKVRGCNLSFWKKDFIAINGYNNDFEGWGREDSDLVIRLGLHGIQAKRIKYKAIVYHLFHPDVSSKNNIERNNHTLEQMLQKKVVRCENGYNQI